jgi:hypothetical protein
MLAAGPRHLRFLLVLALLAAGTSASGEPRHLRSHAEDAGARSDDSRDQDRSGRPIFAAAFDRMIRACGAQAAQLRTLPLEAIAQSIRLRDDQRDALAQVRSSANDAAKVLDAGCPKSATGRLTARMDAIGAALKLMADSLNALRPALASFYGLLDDEQKGRLVVTSISSNRPSQSDRSRPRKEPQSGAAGTSASKSSESKSSAAKSSASKSSESKSSESRSSESRSSESRSSESRSSESKSSESKSSESKSSESKSICNEWAGNLRSWPIRRIETQMRLSDDQLAALYQLTAAIYRSAADLTQACPLEDRVTPLGRLDAAQDELQALREDIEAIRPFAAGFENALDATQKERLAAEVDASEGGRPPR